MFKTYSFNKYNRKAFYKFKIVFLSYILQNVTLKVLMITVEEYLFKGGLSGRVI